MPAFVKTPEDERLWNKAKDRAKEQGHAEDWAYITGIYKKMKGGKVAVDDLAIRYLLTREAAAAPGQKPRDILKRVLTKPKAYFPGPVEVSGGHVKVPGKKSVFVSLTVHPKPPDREHTVVLSTKGEKSQLWEFPTKTMRHPTLEHVVAEIIYEFAKKQPADLTAVVPPSPSRPVVNPPPLPKAAPAPTGPVEVPTGEVASILKRLNYGPGGRAFRVEWEGDGWTVEPSNRQRLDHYVGRHDTRDPDDDMYDPEGWDEDSWREDYADPIWDIVVKALAERFGKDRFFVEVGEKGHVHVQPNRKFFKLGREVIPSGWKEKPSSGGKYVVYEHVTGRVRVQDTKRQHTERYQIIYRPDPKSQEWLEIEGKSSMAAAFNLAERTVKSLTEAEAAPPKGRTAAFNLQRAWSRLCERKGLDLNGNPLKFATTSTAPGTPVRSHYQAPWYGVVLGPTGHSDDTVWVRRTHDRNGRPMAKPDLFPIAPSWLEEVPQLPSPVAAKWLRMAADDRTAKTNQKVIEAPHNFFPVELQPPQAKRKEYPFEGFIDFQGIKIDVENKKGSVRSGVAPDGTEWSSEMFAHYGEIRGTEGVDGDKLDVYVGDNHDSSIVVVIHQHEPSTGAYDEDKVMIGFDSIEEAIGAYKKQYDKPGYFVEGEYTSMPIGQFWRWVNDTRKKGKKVTGSVRTASKVGLSYPGNLGIMEMVQFYRIATPAQEAQMEALIKAGKVNEAWQLIQDVTGVKLHPLRVAAITVSTDQLPPIGATVSYMKGPTATDNVVDLHFDSGHWVPVHTSRLARRVACFINDPAELPAAGSTVTSIELGNEFGTPTYLYTSDGGRIWFHLDLPRTAALTVSDPDALLMSLLAILRGLSWAHWTSHWQAGGDTSYGDHLLFERLYEGTVKEIDGLAEKMVALLGPQSVDPVAQASLMTTLLDGVSGEACPFQRAIDAENVLQIALKDALPKLEAAGKLSLGLDDFLRTVANDHETNLYLLKQRIAQPMARTAHKADRGRAFLARAALKRVAADPTAYVGTPRFNPHVERVARRYAAQLGDR